MPNPNMWIVMGGIWRTSVTAPGYEYMPNEQSMVQRLLVEVNEIRGFDPEAFITVVCAGRGSGI
jgi:hypothetical protein